MKRRTLPVAAALVATATLLLTACGGSDGGESKGNDKIAGVDTGSETSASASPSDTAAAAEGRPQITFPGGVANVFEDEKTGDTKKDAVLADNAQRINSIDDAIFQDKASTAALGYYSKDKALTSAVTFIQGYLDKNLTWTGTTRYFDRKVTIGQDGTATLVYCADESKSFLKNRKTGKIDNTPTSATSYVLYNTKLAKNDQGVWQTINVISVRGAKQCQP